MCLNIKAKCPCGYEYEEEIVIEPEFEIKVIKGDYPFQKIGELNGHKLYKCPKCNTLRAESV
jgi:hypothetical protein